MNEQERADMWKSYQKVLFVNYLNLHQDYKTRKNVHYMAPLNKPSGPVQCIPGNFIYNYRHPLAVPYRPKLTNFYYPVESALNESGMWYLNPS
jgi:hypothetical protein